MTIKDILDYYRKFIKKSRSLCAKHFNAARLNVKRFVKNTQSSVKKCVVKTQKIGRLIIEKTKAFRAQHLNLKPIDIFLIIAVITALAYVVVNHAFELVNAPERVNITISSQCAELFGKETVDDLVREFEKQNPELRIREAASIDSADIVFFDDSELVSLTHTVSLVSFMDLFIYNIDILQAANLDRPPKTRAEFLAAAKAVAENNADGKVFPFALGLSPEDPLALRRDFYPWIWASGVDINNAELSRPVNDVIAFFGQLNREQLLAPDSFEKTGAQRLTEFAEGKIAMLTISSRDLLYFWDNATDFAFGITALPALTQGKNRVGLSGIYAGIKNDSEVPYEARQFLTFLARKSDVLAEAIGAVPGSYPAVFAGDYIEKNEVFSKAWEIFSAADIVDYKPGQPSGETFNHLVEEKLVDALKIEPPKEEPPKVEPPRVEPPRAEPPRAEPPRTETPQAEAPKTEAPQAEPPADSP